MNKQIIQNAIYDFATAISLAADDTTGYKSIYVGGAGTVKVDMKLPTTGAATATLFLAVPVGTLLPIEVSRVYSTGNGTTASNLIGLQ